MTRPARLRCVLIAVLAAVLAIYFLVVVSPSMGSKPRPIGLEVVRLTHDAKGYALAVVQLTNRTHVGFNYAFWTEVLSNGVWVDALTQPPDARMANWLAPHQHRTVELPVPREGSAWRIELDGGWVLAGRVEMLLCRACRSLKLPYQFAQDLHVYSETNEVVAVPNPQGGASGRQPFGSVTNRSSAAAAFRRSP